MRQRDDIEILAALFGRLAPVDTGDTLKQRNVRIRSHTDAVIVNLARTADLPYQTMANLVLAAGIQALEDRIGREAFESVADYEHGWTDDGEEVCGPVTNDSRDDGPRDRYVEDEAREEAA